MKMSSSDAVLLLRLAGPMQSWGSASKFTRRTTNSEPTKSGIVGILAAAKGRARTDSIEDIARLKIGVRIDRAGVLVQDFQTATRKETRKEVVMPLSYRYYLADAVFLAAIQAEKAVIEGLREAVENPGFPLALGRRSCPPAGKVIVGTTPGSLQDALANTPWLGKPVGRSNKNDYPSSLMVVRDLIDGESTAGAEREHDQPISFDSAHRKMSWRWVKRYPVTPPGLTSEQRDGSPPSATNSYDYFAEVG